MGDVFIAVLAIGVLVLLYERWPRSPQALYDHRYRKLMDDMRRRGLSPKQQDEEMLFRRAMARLRRRATAAVLEKPGSPNLIVSDLAAEEAARLATVSRDVARRFLDVVKESPLSDILYADALKAAKRAAPKPRKRRTKITEDDIASVTML